MSDNSSDNKNDINEFLSSDAPTEYVNGFSVAAGHADVIMFFQKNGNSNLTVNMSYTTAKTLVESLQNILTTFEEKTGLKLKTIKQIEKDLRDDS